MSIKPYPKYKDSGVAWLGMVPEGWDVFRSKVLFRQIREPSRDGDEQLSSTQKYGVIPQKMFMALQDQKVVLALGGLSGFKRINEGDFVISLRSFQGGIERSAHGGCVSPAYTVLRPSSLVEGSFFSYLLKEDGYIQSLQTMTDGIREGKTISYDQFAAIGVVCPPISEQSAIASFLDHETSKIDALISEQEKLIELLKEKRSAVISHAVTKGLNPDVKMKDSGVEWLGMVPEGWEVRRLGYFFQQRREKVSDKDYPALSVTKNGVVPQLETAAKTDDGDNRKLVRSGDFVINSRSDRKGSSGASSLNGSVSLINTVIRPVVGIELEFVHHLLRSVPFQEEFYRNGKGIVADLWSTNYSEMRDIFLAIPNLSEQSAIASFLDHETSKIDALITESQLGIDLLQERRSALISAAVTGQIDVRDFNPSKAA
jgi:type I restriction enzyme S subunit